MLDRLLNTCKFMLKGWADEFKDYWSFTWEDLYVDKCLNVDMTVGFPRSEKDSYSHVLCSKDKGHKGPHGNRMFTWDNAEDPPPILNLCADCHEIIKMHKVQSGKTVWIAVGSDFIGCYKSGSKSTNDRHRPLAAVVPIKVVK